MSIRVLLADDHRLLRDGIAALLQQAEDITLVGQAEDGHALLRLAHSLRPDVVVTDISMPGLNGIEAVRRLRAESDLPVLCLSVHDEDRLVLAMIDAGAMGYLQKDCSYDELVQAVRQVAARRVYLSPALSGVMVRAWRERQTAPARGAFQTLTPRERELVQLFSEGYTTNEIAERLHLSPKTVATHRENVLHKLQARGVAELTRYALREGLSTLDAPLRGAAAPD